ncbi:MAG: 4-hydroxy-3-methylbut-2-enyl diphosphate reductase [Bacteroidales bacterium]|nr:4-hydroxy-3-methylbut-2-enyl diphosphate reductase [Bacteroidales bacterium]
MQTTIDPKAGYCFGVKNAIGQAEAMLEEYGQLYSLGDIVHNKEEVQRLGSKGLKVIDYEEFGKLRNCKVLIRAHGEPPSTYEIAYQNNILLIDATCPIVKHLQGNIKAMNDLASETNSQVVIYGKKNHPEVNGLVGQTGATAIVVTTEVDIQQIDPQKSVHLYAQTTMDPQGFELMAAMIKSYLKEVNTENTSHVFIHNTICRQVSNRIEHLKKFAAENELLLFVSGNESSNGRFLFEVCRNANPRSYHIESRDDIDPEWFLNLNSIGITGATSTPVRQMNDVMDFIASLNLKA